MGVAAECFRWEAETDSDADKQSDMDDAGDVNGVTAAKPTPYTACVSDDAACPKDSATKIQTGFPKTAGQKKFSQLMYNYFHPDDTPPTEKSQSKSTAAPKTTRT